MDKNIPSKLAKKPLSSVARFLIELTSDPASPPAPNVTSEDYDQWVGDGGQIAGAWETTLH